MAEEKLLLRLVKWLLRKKRWWLAVKNWCSHLPFFRPESVRDKFSVVLCWLEEDNYNGNNTKTVAQAFTKINGIKLFRSARIVSATGAGDDW